MSVITRPLLPNAVSMLAHRLRRWSNIETALGKCLMYAGIEQAGRLATHD